MKRAILIATLCIPTVCSAASPQTPTTLFGLTLGAPLSLPDCILDESGHVSRQFTLSEICARAWPESGPIRTYDIGIPPALRPSFLKYPEIAAETIDGNVEWIFVMTTGRTGQEEVFSQLVDKFNQPTEAGADDLQNAAGGKFSSLKARWYIGDDQLVEFHGIDQSLDLGTITALTKKWKELDAKTRPAAPPHL